MKRSFYYMHLETKQQTTNLSNLLDELRSQDKSKDRLNILLSSI